MRSILCPVDNSPTLDDRVETALALARAMDGHVTFQIATPFAALTLWEPFGGAALSAEAINQARMGDETLGSELDARLAPQDVPFDVVIIDEGRIEGVASAARFTDIVVTTLEDPTLEEIGLGIQVPVLAVPRGRPMLVFDKPVVVAWDGGHEGAAAMRAALPLLRLATPRRGCSGLAYSVDYVTEAKAFDEKIETPGGILFIDGGSVLYLIGSTMDWVEDDFQAGFVFANPNAKGSCGCGESFTV